MVGRGGNSNLFFLTPINVVITIFAILVVCLSTLYTTNIHNIVILCEMVSVGCLGLLSKMKS